MNLEYRIMNEDNKKYLGVDWGGARIGLALGDSEVKLASPFKTVGSLEELFDIIKDEEIDVIVLGKPVKMSGQSEDLTEEFENFLEDLQEEIKIPIELIDERLSSQAADSLVGDKKTKAQRDEVAAMLILQSYLDKRC